MQCLVDLFRLRVIREKLLHLLDRCQNVKHQVSFVNEQQ